LFNETEGCYHRIQTPCHLPLPTLASFAGSNKKKLQDGDTCVCILAALTCIIGGRLILGPQCHVVVQPLTAASSSLKDLSKAINTFIQSPRLPLPDELNEVITAYLEKHDRNDESSSERLNNELISVYQKCVVNRPDKYAAFLALLRPLRPAIRTSARLVQWWDRLIEPILEYMSQERGLAKEALANVLDLVSFEEEGPGASDSQGPNVFADRLLRRWMQVLELAELGDNPSTEFNERVIREGITRFGKKDPKASATVCKCCW